MKTHVIQLSSKGQLVIPAELRRELGLRDGMKVAVQRQGHSILLHPLTDEFIDSFIGSTKGAGDERERSHRDDKDR